ncbi:hypothetical protein GJAV_G00152390 [Gymnothorax javanicus]|nr:hypothetical protein GJAV_G00152390 [Gymnothorax javanicus]
MQTESLGKLHHVSKAAIEMRFQRPIELNRSSSTRHIPRAFSATSDACYRRGSMSSSFTDNRAHAHMSCPQPVCTQMTPNCDALQNLLLISSPAPLIKRPDLLQPPHKTHLRNPTAVARVLGDEAP